MPSPFEKFSDLSAISYDFDHLINVFASFCINSIVTIVTMDVTGSIKKLTL